MTMINKIVEAGISKEQILESFIKNGSEGLTILLIQDAGGKPRVTESQAILKKICIKIREIMKKLETQIRLSIRREEGKRSKTTCLKNPSEEAI